MSSFSNMAYDGEFNLKGETASSATWYPAPGTLNWSYDNKDRLTAENSARGSANWTQNFGYDNAGNPTSFKGVAQTFNANNQQTGVSSYDGNGNPVSYRGSGASFDAENRMTSLGSGFTAGYRSDGLRAWKGAGDARTYYLYDQGEPIIELDSKGNIQAMNVFAPDGLVGRWSMTGIWAKSWSYYVFDQQGNVDHRTDAKGGLRTSSVYDAYGLDRANASKGDPFGYNGRWGYYRDVETGLYLCQHRYYDPSTGRWLTRDPIGYAGGIGLYGYCGGGSVGSADSSGHGYHNPVSVWVDPGFKGTVVVVGDYPDSGEDQYEYIVKPGMHTNPQKYDADVITIYPPGVSPRTPGNPTWLPGNMRYICPDWLGSNVSVDRDGNLQNNDLGWLPWIGNIWTEHAKRGGSHHRGEGSRDILLPGGIPAPPPTSPSGPDNMPFPLGGKDEGKPEGPSRIDRISGV